MLRNIMENIFHDVVDADVSIDDFVLSPIHEMIILHYCAPYTPNCKTIDSQLIH
jgi:hypothetical protein